MLVGALLGNQANRQVVVANSFELQVVDGTISIAFFDNRKEQCKSSEDELTWSNRSFLH